MDWKSDKFQVDDLSLRVHQLTNFIRDRGLFEAFKAFIAPGKSAITTVLDEKKYDIALEKLDYKIGRYEIAQKTGELTWD